jgi:hypothetical protein
MLKLLTGPFRWVYSASDREIMDVGAPTEAGSAASKAYVDSAVAGGGGGAVIDDTIADDASGSNLVTRSAAKIGALIAAALASVARYATTRSALAGAVFTSAPCYLAEAGREGTFVFDSSNLSAFVTADTQQGLYVAPASDTTGASGAWVRKHEGLSNIEWWGAVADDSTDNHTAIQAALDTLAALKMTGTEYGYGFGSPGLRIPARPKPFYSSVTPVVGQTMVIQFDNGGGAAGGCAVLRVPDAVTGLIVDITAAGTVIDRPMLYGGYSATESEHHGIELRAKAIIKHPQIFRFPGDGIHGDGSLYNINDTEIDHPFIQECRDNIFLYSSNANACSINQPHVILARRWGIWLKDTIGRNTITGGDYSSNGWNNNSPATMCVFSGRVYFVLPGQEVGASTNAPSGTSAINTWWGYLTGSGAVTPTSFQPAWVSGMTWRAGGVMYLSGNSNFNTVVGGYQEGDGPPAFGEGNCVFFHFDAVLVDGNPHGGFIDGNTSQVKVPRTLVVGDVKSPYSGRNLICLGNATFGPDASEVSNADVMVNTTASTATYNFQKNGSFTAALQYNNADASLYYLLLTGGSHKFYCNGSSIGVISSTGLAVTGTVAATGAVTGSNLSGTHSGTSSGTNTGDQTITLTGDVTGTGVGSFAATIANSSVTLAKMAPMATASVIYRKTAGTGAPEVQTLATLKTDLGLTGTNSGDQTITLTGNVTGSGTGSFATTIPAGTVTLAMQANMATASVVYRKTAGAGAPEVQTLATLKTDLAITESDVTNLTTDLAAKAPLASPVFTGNIYQPQPTPTAVNATATLTIAQILTIIITCSSTTAVSMTLPTGTLTDAGILSGALSTDHGFEWSIINTGSSSGAITVLAGTAHTIVGSATVAIGTSSRWFTRKTATNTFVTTRIA